MRMCRGVAFFPEYLPSDIDIEKIRVNDIDELDADPVVGSRDEGRGFGGTVLGMAGSSPMDVDTKEVLYAQ